jgi:hypothetical protein
VPVTKYYSGDEIKEDGMGGMCGTHWKKKRNEYRGLVGNPQRKNHFEDVCLDGVIILKFILKK